MIIPYVCRILGKIAHNVVSGTLRGQMGVFVRVGWTVPLVGGELSSRRVPDTHRAT